MVAKKVLPQGVTIRPVAGPTLMTIDRSICKIVGVVSLTVEVYDCDNARQGIHPGEDEPRIPFPVSALVVDSLAYDVILGHDFLNHFELDIRYSESPTRIVGHWPFGEAPRLPWFMEHPVQAANLTSTVQVYASSARYSECGNGHFFHWSYPEYLPAGAGRYVYVVSSMDDPYPRLVYSSDASGACLASSNPSFLLKTSSSSTGSQEPLQLSVPVEAEVPHPRTKASPLEWTYESGLFAGSPSCTTRGGRTSRPPRKLSTSRYTPQGGYE
ncbi:hypothetical protein FOZ61_002564 [Perkinsus olseni]|uniref:Uncharacterized protein n=1 Tax=Perkinsus olseni TaxID=32597 RepID=A0A7J6KN24_PEROL|nr:hypothetical protein FOZ61_002564 [Perkinsus olseni]